MGREQFDFEAVSGRTDEGRTVSYKSPAPEPLMMGANYDRTAPRKYVRMHLLGQEGARLMWGRWVSAPYGGTQGQWFTQLFTQHDGPDDREGVFPAVIEMFAGEPAIATTDLLNIRDNESDARRAVAVKVVTVHGHEDFLFSDGRPDRTRVIDAGPQTVTASGEYAYISTDRRGLRQASLVAGQTLEKPGVVIIQPQTAAYTGTIKTIDHLRRSFTLDSDLPGELIGHAVWEVGNDQHRTSLEIPKVRGRKLDFRKGLELVSTRVVSVDRQAGEVVGRLVSILMGAEEDNGMKPGMTSGLWASNEDLTKWWQCEYTGGSRDNGYTYKLTGSPIGEKDFPVGGTLRIWELGPGDQARLATRVNLRRNERHPDRYELSANVACRIALPATAAGYEHSADGLTWEPIPTESRDGMLWLTFTPETLQNGERHLRPTQH